MPSSGKDRAVLLPPSPSSSLGGAALSVQGNLMASSEAHPLRKRNKGGEAIELGSITKDSNGDEVASSAWRRQGSVAASGHGHHHMTREERALMESYESLDYDIVRNDVYTREVLLASKKKRRMLNIRSWVTFAIIGMCTGAIGFFIDSMVELLVDSKFETTKEHIEPEGAQFTYGRGYLVFLSLSLTFGLISTLLVNFVEPVAAGSGIPEVKGYLNGTNYLRFLRVPTGIVKIIGVIFSVSGGLIVGKEGPLIHIGSILAANFATLPGLTRAFGGRFLKFAKEFRHDKSKRDFVSGGAAAGVAAAFGSPTGGIMFALEEASSFWSLSLTWKSYLCTMLSTSTIWTLLAWRDEKSSYRGLVTFGSPGDLPQFKLWELPFFFFLGAFGGLAGALFCEINFRISKWRRSHTQGRTFRRIAEVMCCVALTATAFFWLPIAIKKCTQKVANYRCTDLQNRYVDPSRQYNCTDYVFYEDYGCNPGEYNELGTIMFQGSGRIIKALFHNPPAADAAGFSPHILVVYTIVCFVLAVVTYGVAVPSGLFVPCILIGSGFGRLMGELMHMWDPSTRPGVYALIGAASMLSGVCRITITLTVILYETTDQLDLILPIMGTVIIAKWVADCFNISLYDMHIELKCIPFVESHPPRAMEGMTAKEVMSSPAQTLYEVDTLANIMALLRSTKHNGFVVVSESGACRGMILRNQLIVLLKHGRFGGTVKDTIARPRGKTVLEEDLLDLSAFAPSLQSKMLGLDDAEKIIADVDPASAMDLRSYMNPASITVSGDCPITRCYNLFRGMGIRHLPVVSNGRVVGIITRKELMTDFSQDLY